MECPKCNYVTAELVEGEWLEGDKGDFYSLPSLAKSNVDLCCCPSCGNVFIEV